MCKPDVTIWLFYSQKYMRIFKNNYVFFGINETFETFHRKIHQTIKLKGMKRLTLSQSIASKLSVVEKFVAADKERSVIIDNSLYSAFLANISLAEHIATLQMMVSKR